MPTEMPQLVESQIVSNMPSMAFKSSLISSLLLAKGDIQLLIVGILVILVIRSCSTE